MHPSSSRLPNPPPTPELHRTGSNIPTATRHRSVRASTATFPSSSPRRHAAGPDPAADRERPLLSIRATARRLDLSARAVYRLIASGALPPPLRLGGSRKFLESDLDEYLARLRSDRN